MPESTDIVIVGGGTTGLLAAALLSTYYPHKSITLLEKNASVGGLLRSFDYGENGRFDYGAHNFQETLIPEIDSLFLNLLPPDAWHILPGAKREIAGNFFKGKIRNNTPFMDLRNLEQDDYEACMRDFFLNINTENGAVTEYPEDALGFSMVRYGKAITERLVAPAVHKLFGLPLDKVHRLPLLFLPLSRIAFLQDNIVCDLTKSDILRERLAYSNQRELPLERSSGKRIFYPKVMGMQQMIDGFETLLQERGVKILTGATVSALETHSDNTFTLSVQSKEDTSPLHAKELIWTAGIHPLARILDLFYPEDTFDKPLKTVFCHYRLDHRLAMDDMYFLYPFDSEFKTYRVVNYANYCPQAAEGPTYPVTIEMFLTEGENISNDELKALGFEELKKMKLVPDNTKVHFSAVEMTPEGFPMPTLRNMALTKTRRERIEALGLKNLTLLGILAKDDLLFHKDIILHTYEHIHNVIAAQPVRG